MQSLVTIEADLRPVRAQLSTHRDQASRLPGFAGVDNETLNSEYITANLDLPLPDEEATFYADALRHGGKLVIVNTDADHSDMVWSVMRNSNASQYTEAERH